MADSQNIPNPFRAPAAPAAPAADDANLRPFATVQRGVAGNQLRGALQTRIRDMDLGGVDRSQVTARAADLTVKDLNDLAAEFSGVRTNNPNVARLSIEDINSIEAVFFEVKIRAARAARTAATAAPSGEQAPFFDNWSCCCCTPCCSCAATDTSPFPD